MFLSSAWVCTLLKYEPASNVSEVSDHLLREDSDMNTNKQYAPLSPTSLGDWTINTTQSFHNYFTVAVCSLSHSTDGRGQRPLKQPQWQKFSGSAARLSLALKCTNDHHWCTNWPSFVLPRLAHSICQERNQVCMELSLWRQHYKQLCFLKFHLVGFLQEHERISLHLYVWNQKLIILTFLINHKGPL